MELSYENLVHIMRYENCRSNVIIYDNNYSCYSWNDYMNDIDEYISKRDMCLMSAYYNSIVFSCYGKCNFFIGNHIFSDFSTTIDRNLCSMLRMKLPLLLKNYVCGCSSNDGDNVLCTDDSNKETIVDESIEEKEEVISGNDGNDDIDDYSNNNVDWGDDEELKDYTDSVLRAITCIPYIREKRSVLVCDGTIDNRLKGFFFKQIKCNEYDEDNFSGGYVIVTDNYRHFEFSNKTIHITLELYENKASEVYLSKDGWYYFLYGVDSNGHLGHRVDKHVTYFSSINSYDVYYAHDHYSSNYMKDINDYGLRCNVVDDHIHSRTNTEKKPTVSFLGNGMMINVRKIVDLSTGKNYRVKFRGSFRGKEMWVFRGSIVFLRDGDNACCLTSNYGRRFIFARKTVYFEYASKIESYKCVLRVFDDKLINDGYLKAFDERSYLLIRDYELR